METTPHYMYSNYTDIVLVGPVIAAPAFFVLTYPFSFILMSLGLMEPARRDPNRFLRMFDRANAIVGNQFLLGFFAFILTNALCGCLFLVWGLVHGALLKFGVLGEYNLWVPFFVFADCLHLATQLLVYRYAIRESSEAVSSSGE